MSTVKQPSNVAVKLTAEAVSVLESIRIARGSKTGRVPAKTEIVEEALRAMAKKEVLNGGSR